MHKQTNSWRSVSIDSSDVTGGSEVFVLKVAFGFINHQNLVKSLIQLSCSFCCPETECVRGSLYTISATSNLLLFYYSNLTGSHGGSETKLYRRKMNINNPVSLRKTNKSVEISCFGSTQSTMKWPWKCWQFSWLPVHLFTAQLKHKPFLHLCHVDPMFSPIWQGKGRRPAGSKVLVKMSMCCEIQVCLRTRLSSFGIPDKAHAGSKW